MATRVALSTDSLIGLSIDEAKTLIFKSGYRFKIIREDGFGHPVPTDSRDDRFLLTTASGIVVNAVVG